MLRFVFYVVIFLFISFSADADVDNHWYKLLHYQKKGNVYVSLVESSEYFLDNSPENPYTEDPCNVKCVSFDPNGDVLGGNAYENDVLDILKNYEPTKGINL